MARKAAGFETRRQREAARAARVIAALKPKFPRTVFVHQFQQTDGAEPILVIEREPDEATDGEPVAIYVLQEVKTMRVIKKLVES